MKQSGKSLFILATAVVAVSACGGDAGPDDTGGAGSAGTSLGGSSNSASGSGQTSAGIPGNGGTNTTAGTKATGGTLSAAGTSSGGSTSTAGSATAGSSSGGTATAGSSSGGTGGSSGCVAPIDPNATAEAKKLLCYIYSIYGTKVLSGQQETSWSNPQSDIDYYMTTVGKHPAILGGDYLYQDGAKPGGNTTKRAIAYWNAGGLTMMRYHMGAPPNSDSYDNAKLSVAKFDNLYTENTTENTALKSKLDYLAGELKVLQDAKVPVLMVPYHEIDQYAWFWWSKGTGPQFVKLWKYTVDYITKTKGVHNALWLMGYAHDGAMADYWPGKAYVDLGGIDQYDHGTQPFTNLFKGTKAVVGSTIPIPLHETGTIPQPSAMFPSAAPWVLWNVWATYENTNAEGYTWNTPDSIKSAYNDSHTVTRESLPSQK
jgi:beta-mannanase